MNWDHVKVFLALAEKGSLTAASEQLGLSPPTISRHISRLEHLLDVRLFSRRHDGYQLTTSGTDLVPVALEMQSAAARFSRQAGALLNERKARVRLASGFWFSRLITERMGVFHAQHPDIEIELVTGHAIADLERGDADISIRNKRPLEGDLVMRKLADASFAVYGSVKYVADNPRALGEERYQTCDWIVGGHSLERLASQVWLRQKLQREPILKCSQTLQFLDAAKSGIGLTLLPNVIGDREPSLVQASRPVSMGNDEIWLVVHEHMKNAPTVRAVINWLVPLFRSLHT